jgi:PAS domain S-box-containing protein
MFDLAGFGLTDSIDLGISLRRLGTDAHSIEQVAHQIIQRLHADLVDGSTGQPACILARLFKTHRYSKLGPSLQEQVRGSVGARAESLDCRCLTLLATAGATEDWDDPVRSRGHRVIPLLSADAIQGAPMLAQLFSQFGLGLTSVTDPNVPLLLRQDETTFQVFHVPEALGSPYIPAQKDFVEPFGVRSVLGFGAPLATGEVFAIIVFTRTRVSPEVAELFRPIALNVKVALLPYEGADTIVTGRADGLARPGRPAPPRQSLERIVAYGDTLQQLLSVHEGSAKKATLDLEARNAELARARDRAVTASDEKARILAAVDAFFICVDDKGVVTEWTAGAEEIFGIAARDAIGRPFQQLSIAWSWSEVIAAGNQARETLKDVRLHRVALGSAGKEKTFLKLTVSPLFNDRRIALILMGENITERVHLERDLTQAQKLESIGQLAAGVAHEINTPTQFIGDNVHFLSETFAELDRILQRHQDLLAAVKAQAVTPDLVESLEATATGSDLPYLREEIPKALAAASEGITRIATIVQAMKQFAHPGRHEKAAVDLNAAIRSTVIVSRNEWKYIADLVTDLAPDLPLIPCLEGELNQVVLNLIVNASHAIADATSEIGGRGTITISSLRAGDWVEIRVADTGTGIPEHIRDRIYDPFFTTKEVGKGTGQGLAIGRSVIVDKHGGTIAVETAMGKGSTFIIRLPLGDSASAATHSVAPENDFEAVAADR